ncbi:MAG: hypothetical protein CL677_07955 [Bdellovibrionaceae bacterium]|nr:hypothetical protein [Pseudobdellovibrionaceae bacterium]|tara:strand:- start:75964 stop:76473 length:510 start_codon:yes stop_codon:yes gene_type:complete
MPLIVNLLTTSLISLLAFNLELNAVQVSPPEKMEFSSKNNQINMTISNQGSAVVQAKETTYNWSEPVRLPSAVVISESKNSIFLLGGYGDSGSTLGLVDIYQLDGKSVAKIDLNDSLPDLKTMSSNSSPMTNYPWLSSYQLSEEEDQLHLRICDQLDLAISITGKIQKK